MNNKIIIENTILSHNSFSAFEKVIEIQLLQFSEGKELWIHSEEDGAITLNMDEAIRMRDYLNSLDLKQNKDSETAVSMKHIKVS
ncbi:hypothetical protein [Bacteroides reticulotermitis]|uniref:hypothetical protein n=1 Tax=Bacteroides reticulotermitis TaxID=1133319 RepID=UPI003A8A7E7B